MRQLTASLRLATRRLNRAQRRRPRLFFVPSPGLAEFMADDSPRQCVLAANRVGKTFQAIKKLADRMIARPGLRCRIVGPTSKRVNRVHTAYLFRFIQDHLAPGCTWKDGVGFNGFNLCRLRNGSTCEFMSYDADPQSGEGDEMDIVLLDEPPPPAFFTSAEARVFSRNGSVWVTLTAVDRPVKYLKDIVMAGVRDRELGRGPGWSFYQVALSAANCPWYTEEQVAERIREAARTPWQYHQRILGEWDGVSDSRRFVAFQETNLLTLAVPITKGWPWGGAIQMVLAVDHGEGKGNTAWVLFAYITRTTKRGVELCVRALAEWTNPDRMSAKREARAVRDMLEAAGVRLDQIAWAVGDTNVASKSDAAKTLNEVFERQFALLMGADPDQPRLRIRPARKGPDSIERGIGVCNQLLDEAIGAARGCQVSEACVHVVESLRHWDGKDTDLKHAADAFRYGVTAIVDEAGYEPVRLMAA